MTKSPAEIDPKLLNHPATLGNTFGHVQNAYAQYFNNKYSRVSSLFEHRYERIEVDTLPYFRQLVVYHHRNPVKHGIVNDYRNYLWTSYQELSSPHVTPHVKVQLTLRKFGSIENFFAAHQQDVPPEMANFEFDE